MTTIIREGFFRTTFRTTGARACGRAYRAAPPLVDRAYGAQPIVVLGTKLRECYGGPLLYHVALPGRKGVGAARVRMSG
jgi:hypothetical protein